MAVPVTVFDIWLCRLLPLMSRLVTIPTIFTESTQVSTDRANGAPDLYQESQYLATPRNRSISEIPPVPPFFANLEDYLPTKTAPATSFTAMPITT